MIIFVDGPQLCGKSTLIDNCKYKHNRFPFNQYMDKFEIPDIASYQLGKDLGILFALQYTKENIVFDRGPFSTIFYSLKEMRYGRKTLEIIMKFINELKRFKNCKYVIVKKINNEEIVERIHNDGFDYLNDDQDPEKDKLWDEIIKAGRNAGLNISVFENDFSIKIKQNIHNFNFLLEDLTNEYNRN